MFVSETTLLNMANKLKKVLSSLLDKYEQEGIVSIETGSILKVSPLSDMGSPVELVRAFGKKKDF